MTAFEISDRVCFSVPGYRWSAQCGTVMNNGETRDGYVMYQVRLDHEPLTLELDSRFLEHVHNWSSAPAWAKALVESVERPTIWYEGRQELGDGRETVIREEYTGPLPESWRKIPAGGRVLYRDAGETMPMGSSSGRYYRQEPQTQWVVPTSSLGAELRTLLRKVRYHLTQNPAESETSNADFLKKVVEPLEQRLDLSTKPKD